MQIVALPAWPLWCAAAVLVASLAFELTIHRIPNALNYGAAAAALTATVALPMLRGAPLGGSVRSSLTAALAGLLVLYPLFSKHYVGGGYVKLMAAVGAWIGCALAPWPAVCVTLGGAATGSFVYVAGQWMSDGRAHPGFFQVGTLLGVIAAARLWPTR